jgi:hypothetical protein
MTPGLWILFPALAPTITLALFLHPVARVNDSEDEIGEGFRLPAVGGPSAQKDENPILRRAGVKDLLIGKGARFALPGNVLREDTQVAGHGGIAREAVQLPNPVKNGIRNYFIGHKKNACIP